MPDYDRLTQISIKLWEMQHYFSTISGPHNLEQAQTPSELLESIAIMVDRMLVPVLPEEACTTAQLRRAKHYVSAIMI